MGVTNNERVPAGTADRLAAAVTEGEPYWADKTQARDEEIARMLADGDIVARPESGQLFTSRRSGALMEMKGTINQSGYRTANLSKARTRFRYSFHRIIWIAVNGIPAKGLTVDHINNNKLDNRIQNLQLLTPVENSAKDMYRGNWTMTEEQAHCVRARLEQGEAARDVAASLRLGLRAVQRAARGESFKGAGGKIVQVSRHSTARRLDVAALAEMRDMLRDGCTRADVARRLSVDWQTVNDVLTGKTYRKAWEAVNG